MTHPFYPGGNPRLNHVAMSVAADDLGEANRADLVRYFHDVLGFDELDMMTVDRKRLIFSCVHWDQFLFLIAEEDPLRCPRMIRPRYSRPICLACCSLACCGVRATRPACPSSTRRQPPRSTRRGRG